MYNRAKSPQFVEMQTRDKSGSNNPQYGVIKSPETIAKLRKLVTVCRESDGALVGHYPTVQCKELFNIGYDTMIKCIKTGCAHKGHTFAR